MISAAIGWPRLLKNFVFVRLRGVNLLRGSAFVRRMEQQ